MDRRESRVAGFEIREMFDSELGRDVLLIIRHTYQFRYSPFCVDG